MCAAGCAPGPPRLHRAATPPSWLPELPPADVELRRREMAAAPARQMPLLRCSAEGGTLPEVAAGVCARWRLYPCGWTIPLTRSSQSMASTSAGRPDTTSPSEDAPSTESLPLIDGAPAVCADTSAFSAPGTPRPGPPPAGAPWLCWTPCLSDAVSTGPDLERGCLLDKERSRSSSSSAGIGTLPRLLRPRREACVTTASAPSATEVAAAAEAA
mmetsp:Transcript_1110/g.3099  ORF Transcript_1110/g.3099 Transcript_1110/m.3099 type:complete len:214 (+) Transcript_1110:287-928(+)